MPRANDSTDSDETADSNARRAARRAAGEIRRLGDATRDVKDPAMSDATTSTSGSSPPTPENVPDDVNANRRQTGSTPESIATDSGDSSPSSSSDSASTPDSVNSGRRNTDTTSSNPDGSNDGTSTGTDAPGVTDRPDDLNAGRRATSDASSSEASPQTGIEDGEFTGDDSTAQERAVAGQLSKQIIANNPDVDSRDDFNVSNVRPTESGELTADVTLTDSGREAVEQGQRDAVANMGTTGRSLLARQAAREAGVSRSGVDVNVTESSVDVSMSDAGVERAAERAAASFATGVRTNQFAREQLREEFAGESGDLQSSDVDLDVTRSGVDVGLTEGGESRRAVANAAEASEFARDELTATVTEDGETSVQLTDEALVERVASQNGDVSRDDLQVVEREFRGAGSRADARTERVITLTDENARERFENALREENPNADINISREDGELTATITEEGEIDRAVRLGENFVEDPVSSTVEGTTDIANDSLTAVTEFGEESIDTIANPGRTAESVVDDLGASLDREASNIETGISNAETALSETIADPQGTATDVGEDVFSGLQSTGDGVASLLGEVGDRGSAISNSAAFALFAGTASAAALAEPTPFGEAALVGGAAVGAGVLTAAVAGEEIARTANDFTEGESTVSESELPVQQPNEAVSELEVGEESLSELDVEQVRPDSELSVGDQTQSSEIDVPDLTDNAGEIAVPSISVQQTLIGQEEVPEDVEDPRTISEEDIQSPFAEPDQAPPSTRERMRRDDLFTPARRFPTGESAVIGAGSTSEIDEAEATTPEVGRREDVGAGQGSVVEPGPGIVPGIDDDVGQFPEERTAARAFTGLRTDTVTALGVRTPLQTQTQSLMDTSALLASTLGTGLPNSFSQPNAEAFESSSGFGGDGSSNPRSNRLPFPSSDMNADFDEPDAFRSEAVFSSGFRDVDVDDLL